MLELELQQYLSHEYPQENARCEWKEFKNLKNSFCGNEKDDVISYVSAIANMEEEQKLRYVGRLLVELNKEKQIDRRGLRWILKDYNRSV